MNLRPKTRQRLTVLLIAVLVISAITSVLVIMQLRRYERHRQAMRSAGMEAYQRGDYRTASEQLSKYLGNDRIDSQAIYAYAVSQKNLPRLDMGNLVDARQLFKVYLDLNQGDQAAEHQLLEIYQKLHYASEISTQADQLLAQNPDDVPALNAKLQQLVHDLKFGPALPISMRLNNLTPGDLRAQETTYFLMSRLGQSPAEMIARADGMLRDHPQDARYELLRAVAAYFSSDLAGAKQWLQTAASRTPPDADFTLMLVSDFDRLQMWSDSLELLKRVEANPNAPVAVRAALAQRLWEFKQYDAVLTLLKNVSPNDPNADAQLLGLKALALKDRFGITPEFQADLKCLQSRTQDMRATAWALLLTAMSTDIAGDAIPPVQQCVDAERADPDNPDIRFCLAQQYDRLGESELALQCLRQTVQMQPEWPTPCLEIARIMRQRGQPFDAIAPATAACERDPQSFDAQKMLAEAQYEQLGQNANAIDIKPVLKTVEQLRATAPMDADLLLADIDLLARSDRKHDANQMALAAIVDPGTLEILCRLASLDRPDHLAIAAQLADRAAGVNATAPQQAVELFDLYLNTGMIDKANALLPKMHSNATVGWRLAWLASRDEIGDRTAGSDWAQLADSMPSSLSVQRAAIASPAVLANRALADRTIDHLKALTGDDAIGWRLARARWLLDASDDAKNRANAAAELMAEVARVCPDYAQPRVILGDALAKVGDYNGAIASMQLARNLEPLDPHIALKLAGLLVNQGLIQQTTVLLEGIELSPALSRADRVDAARLYRLAGNNHRAIELLQDGQPMHPDECARDVLLAQLLAERGDHTGAQAIYDRWLQQQAAPAEMVRAAAWYSASHGEMARARQQLSQLNSMQLPAGESELAWAEFEAEFGSITAAVPHFENAAKAAPTNPAIWLRWSGTYLAARDFLGTVKVVGRGLKALPGDQLLMSMSDRALFLSNMQLDANAQPLIESLAENPMDETGILMLGILHDSQTAHESSDALAERLRTVTQQSPRYLPAIDWLVALDCAAGRYDLAATTAARARGMLPVDAEPSRLLTMIWTTAGRWEDALAAATDWQSRTLDHPQAADVAIATVQLQLGRANTAFDVLAPYLKTAIANPAPLNNTTIELAARALCKQNHADRAWRLVQPLTAQSADWRSRWLQIVAGTAKDSISVTDQIDQVGATIPANAVEDQLSLGRAWLTAGLRLNDPDLLRKAESVAMPLTDSTTAPADAWFLLGSIQFQLDTLPEAESALTKAVQLAPNLAEAKNLLALVKLSRNEDLPTAQKLATDAVTANPASSAYHTTLGQADGQLNDFDSAKAQFQLALQLNAQNAEALICLAGVQDRTGQTSEAGITLSHAETVLQALHPMLPALVQNELQRLRDHKPAASAAVDQKR